MISSIKLNKVYQGVKKFILISDFGSGVILLLAAVGSLMFLSTYASLPGLWVFGHDEVHYYKGFEFKLREDGRWVNYIFHDLLRSIAPGIWALLFLTACWVFIYRIAL